MFAYFKMLAYLPFRFSTNNAPMTFRAVRQQIIRSSENCIFHLASFFFCVSSCIPRIKLEIFSRVTFLLLFLTKMGKRRFKTIKLLFKLILLFQIYSHHKFEVEAAQNSIAKSCDECDNMEHQV